jgi:abortive infection bacteriophage resistance protein
MVPLVLLMNSAKTYSFLPKRKENNLHEAFPFWLVAPLVPLQNSAKTYSFMPKKGKQFS